MLIEQYSELASFCCFVTIYILFTLIKKSKIQDIHDTIWTWLCVAGDRYLKPWIIPVPEVTIVPRAKDDECLVLASDGLWDVMSNEEVCDIARKRILLWHKKNGTSSSSAPRIGDSADPAAQAAAECLSKLALQKGSKDNITIVVVDLKAQRKFKSKT